tara:strand:- start:153 stop:353 length:201 start_codon:yes stop_codon:yes gene_type:complete
VKAGDLVRWTPRRLTASWFKTTLCILIEYQKWEKIGTILCDGELIRVRAEDLEKAGKKDLIRYENR